MLYSFPDYYKKFSCVADQCEDTCCAGWQIVIDPVSLKKYKKIQGPFRWEVFKSIHWLSSTFRQDKSRRCAFLNEENLCELYKNAGKKSLCKTCKNYPRHIEEFENVREVTLSLSCPEVTKILLQKKEAVQFIEFEKPGEEEYEDFDVFLYSELVEARHEIIEHLQNRNLSIAVRGGLLYVIAHDIQQRIRRRQLFSCQEVYDKYRGARAQEFLSREIQRFLNTPKLRYDKMSSLLQDFYKMEPLKKDWVVTLSETEELLYSQGCSYYNEMTGQFKAWTKSFPMWEIWMEQLLVYFVSTYFCGAVYDGEVLAKAFMALASVGLIHELCMARWIRNEGVFDEEDMKEVVYRYSREMEHSDSNLNKLEKIRIL